MLRCFHLIFQPSFWQLFPFQLRVIFIKRKHLHHIVLIFPLIHFNVLLLGLLDFWDILKNFRYGAIDGVVYLDPHLTRSNINEFSSKFDLKKGLRKEWNPFNIASEDSAITCNAIVTKLSLHLHSNKAVSVRID